MSNVETVQALSAGGYPLEFIHFWSASPALGQSGVGPECMCQWYPSPIRIRNPNILGFGLSDVTFPTAEHFMMYQKARVFRDKDAIDAILAEPDPSVVKKIGRKVRNFNETTWDRVKYALVVRGNISKFAQNWELRKYLLGTGNAILVEASPYDRIWGIGLTEDDPRANNPFEWRGENLLGFACMDVRDCLRNDIFDELTHFS